jgi:N-methylhydantoinase B
MTPGSLPTNATEIFQEGLRIPPIKLHDKGVRNDTFIKLLRQNVRVPDMVVGDLNAQIAAVSVGERRLAELATEHGTHLLTSAFSELLDRSEEMTRASLSEIRPGAYRFRGYNDNDGVDLEKRIKIEVEITVGGGQFHCDFAGSSSQVRGPFNCPPSSALAAACFVIRAITGSHIPTNGGCFRPITLALPESSIVNPKPPAPVNARISTTKLMTSCMLGALSPALPKRIPAAPSGDLLTLIFGGTRDSGEAFVVGEMISGGTGASASADGVDALETDVTNAMNLPVEAMESDYPLFIHRLCIRQDSGGAGRHRGGLGLIKEYEVIKGPLTFIHRGERHYVAPWGLEGGEDGLCANSTIFRANSIDPEIIPSKLVTTLFEGDRLLVETPGGGGFGDPSERKPEDISRDVLQQKTSLEVARRTYDASNI